MPKMLIFCLLLWACWACEPLNRPMREPADKYENFDKFERLVAQRASVLGKKYAIKETGFDVECIYQLGDLSKLVKEMLDLSGLRYKLIGERHDLTKKQYVSLFSIAGKQYEFRTSSEGDYADLELLLPVLELIAKEHTPNFRYILSNQNGGQIAILLFAQRDMLAAAVEEGYPCSLLDSEWQWDDQWQWGVYSEITLTKIPDLGQLEGHYYETLAELYQQGYNVPRLTRNRMYITDLFKTNSVDILIDGGPDTASTNDIVGNRIKCFWDNWGVLLAYTLVKKYGGQPSLYNKTTRMRIALPPAEYLHKAEVAFGRR
jgi:hypothetical protein